MSALFTVKTFAGFDNTPLRYGFIHSACNTDDNKSGIYVPIVFIPGLGGSVKYAISFLERFVPMHGPIYSLDPRGFGLNENLSPAAHPSGYLKDFHSFMGHIQENDNHGFNEKSSPVIMGLSMGGVYSTLYTTEYEHPFKGEILIAPAFKPNPNLFNLSFRLKNYLNVLCRGVKATVTMPYTIRDLTRNSVSYEDPHLQEPLSLPSLYLFLVERLCKRAFLQLPMINIPTAIVIPGHDSICDTSAMKEAGSRITHHNKTLLVYSGLYHDIMLEPKSDQEKIICDLRNWISSISFDNSSGIKFSSYVQKKEDPRGLVR